MKIIKKLPQNFHLTLKNIFILIRYFYTKINKIDKFQYYLVKILVIYPNKNKLVPLTKCFRLEHNTHMDTYVIALIKYLKKMKKFDRCITEIHFNVYLKEYKHDNCALNKKYNYILSIKIKILDYNKINQKLNIFN